MKKHHTLDEVHEDLEEQLRYAEDADLPPEEWEQVVEEHRKALTALRDGNNYEPARQLYDNFIANIQKLVGDWQPSEADLEQKVTFKEALTDKSRRKSLVRLHQLRAALG